MSVKGFRFQGVVHKYDYQSLENIPEIDDTLSIDGLAADAQATGNAINNVKALIGSPLVANTVSMMVDTSKVYVYTGSESGYTSGNWYYYNGSEWVSGGVYNAVAVDLDDTLTISGKAADAKAAGDVLSDLQDQLDHYSASRIEGTALIFE